MKRYNYYTKVIKKTTKTSRNGVHHAKVADIKIKHCKSCNKCWEIDQQALRNYNPDSKIWIKKELYIYYEDFVTYGKSKEECPKCLELSF